MKKLLIVFALATISLSSFGKKFDNEFYFRFGYSTPSWNQFGLSKEAWNSNVKKIGGTFELGNIFMINSVPSTENMALGINVDYLYVNSFLYNENDVNVGGARIGSKIGPSFTYSPVKKLAFDIYTKADFAWATVVVPYQGSIGDAEDHYMSNVDVGFSTGFNIRYGILMLGIEYNTINPKLSSDKNDGIYLQNVINTYITETNSNEKSKLSSINFTVGLSF